MKGQENLRIEELKKMEPVSQRNVCDALIEHFKADSVGLNIIAPLYCNYADCRADINEAILQKPRAFFTVSAIPHMVMMHNASTTQIDELLSQLKQKGSIKEEICDRIRVGNTVAMSMIRLTVEETNLLSIYNEGGKRALIENVNAALPYMDADMRELAKRTLSKVDALTEAEFAELPIYAADEV